jgi:predicted AlkP superfamily phosphohydrolase/phosphomutase
VAEQGIHVNVRGPLPHGVLDQSDAQGIERELTDRLLAMTDPEDGLPITDRVVPRSEVIHGPYQERAPHLFPLFRDQRYEMSDTVAARSMITDHRDRPWGYHHLDGVFIAAGASVRPRRGTSPLDVVDVVPTSLHLAALPVPQGLDGRVAHELMTEQAAARPVALTAGSGGPDTTDEYPFSPEEEAAIEESLRGLGYLE